MRVNPEEVWKRLLKVLVAETGLDESKISLESTIRDDLSLDSLDTVSLLSELEDEFGIDIEDKEVQGFKIVEEFHSYLIGKLRERA